MVRVLVAACIATLLSRGAAPRELPDNDACARWFWRCWALDKKNRVKGARCFRERGKLCGS